MLTLVQRISRYLPLMLIIGCVLLAGGGRSLSATPLTTIIVESNHPVLQRELSLLLKSLGSKVVSSRQEAILLLRASNEIKKTSAGFQVIITVDLVERGQGVMAAWQNDPTFTHANRDDRESIDLLVKAALLVGNSELRQKIGPALTQLTDTGVIYRINIHRDNAVDPVRLKFRLAQQSSWKLLRMDSNAYGLIIRVRFPGEPAILKSELVDILKGAVGSNTRIGNIETTPRQVITVRCVSGHENNC